MDIIHEELVEVADTAADGELLAIVDHDGGARG